MVAADLHGWRRARVLRGIGAVPLAAGRARRDSGGPGLLHAVRHARVRFAIWAIAGIGNRKLPALGGLSRLRGDACAPNQATSNLGGCRVGPAPLSGS